MECWNAGMLECWNAGMLECWNAGMLECRSDLQIRFASLYDPFLGWSKAHVVTIVVRKSTATLIAPQLALEELVFIPVSGLVLDALTR